jgi:hypothetical protein
MPTAKKTTSVAKKSKVTKTSALATALSQAQTRGMADTMSMSSVAPVQSNMRMKWLVAAWILVIAGALYYFKGQFIVATVNGQPIFRSTLVQELERQSGKATLDNLVLETLVRQEAAKQKVTVTDEEANDELKKLEDRLTQQNQKLDQLLAAQDMTKASLLEQIKLQKLVEKMLSKEPVTVSDEEVTKYLTDNKAFLPKDAKPEELKVEVKKQLEQQKQSTKTQTWLKSLQDNAQVNHWLF